ncbi:MAG: hypothetical protein ACTSUO_00505 [Candidatus Thorarchaeota archaeon]
MTLHQRFLLIVLAVLIMQSTMIPPVIAQEGGPEGSSRALIEVGRFTYRASFQLDDGTEFFLIRSSYQITFLFQHHEPVLRQHFFSASVGFYFGKTMLGRPIVQSVEFDSLAFYPKWLSSAGYSFDLLGDTPVVELGGAVNDGQLLHGMMLIDNYALTKDMAMFGGTYVFSNLIITLDDGSIIDFDEEDFHIEVSQNDNEYVPEDAILLGEGSSEYNFEPRIVNINTGTSVPTIVYLDIIIGYFLIGTGIVLLGLVILHLKGRIVLPIEKMIRVLSRNNLESME